MIINYLKEIGLGILAILGFFLYAFKKGKKAKENDLNKEFIHDAKVAKKIQNDIDKLDRHELVDKLQDKL